MMRMMTVISQYTYTKPTKKGQVSARCNSVDANDNASIFCHAVGSGINLSPFCNVDKAKYDLKSSKSDDKLFKSIVGNPDLLNSSNFASSLAAAICFNNKRCLAIVIFGDSVTTTADEKNLFFIKEACIVLRRSDMI